MGIVRRQSIQVSILSYLGFGLGYINAILLFPAFFKPEEFGLTRVLIAVVSVAAQFALFGVTNAIVRFYPRFKDGDETHQHGLLGMAIAWGTVGILLVGSVLYFVQSWVIESHNEGSVLFQEYYMLLFPYLIFEVFYQIFAGYNRAIYKSVINTFFREVFVRLCTTALILAFSKSWIGLNEFMWLFVFQHGVVAVGMAAYLIIAGRFGIIIDRDFLTRDLRKEILKYLTFTSLTNVSAMMLLSIDILMIGYMVGFDGTAFYSVAFYIMALLNIPSIAITNISTPIVSEAWKRKDMDAIQQIYSKTSINQLLLGTLIFIGIWANESNIFQVLPDEYSGGKWVLFFVGIGRLIDVGFGINSGIITNSSWYRFDTYSNVALLLVAVTLNFIFIPPFGITGAAIATAISLGVYNIAKYLFLKIKFGFDPFSWQTVATLIVGVLVFGISCLLPTQDHLIVDIMIRSGIILVLYVPIVLGLRLSAEANDLYRVTLKLLRGK